MNEPIKFHDLAPAPRAKKRKTRVGRGKVSKGKATGHGTRGIEARKQISTTFESGQVPLHMYLPKLKGLKSPAKVTFQVVSASDLERLFLNSDDITIADPIIKGVVHANQLVKILDDGDINVSVNVTATRLSGPAKSKIKATGGSVTEV